MRSSYFISCANVKDSTHGRILATQHSFRMDGKKTFYPPSLFFTFLFLSPAMILYHCYSDYLSFCQNKNRGSGFHCTSLILNLTFDRKYVMYTDRSPAPPPQAVPHLFLLNTGAAEKLSLTQELVKSTIMISNSLNSLDKRYSQGFLRSC